MEAYKMEVLVIDFENLGEEDIKTSLENNRHLSVSVENSQCADIGPWEDDHPLNNRTTSKAEYERIFPK